MSTQTVIDMKKIISIFILFASLGALGQSPQAPEFWFWKNDVFEKMISNNYMGSVKIHYTSDVDENADIIIIDKLLKFGSRGKYFLGKVSSQKNYNLALIPGDYELKIYKQSGFFSKEINITREILITPGKVIQVKIDKKEINLEEEDFSKDWNLGSITTDGYVRTILRSYVRVYPFRANEKSRTVQTRVQVTNEAKLSDFTLNGNSINSKNKRVVGWNLIEYYFDLTLEEGENIFVATSYGIDGEPYSDSAKFNIKTSAELEKERIIKQRQEEERLARIEIDRRARIVEEERIAREGDSSPDDLQCKKYGLKPQTQGYAECRMRLDLVSRDQQRLRDQIEQQRFLQQQQLESVEIIRKNRESQCRFVQSAEYLKPSLGGFFESMNRANSAFENCMNGVPNINTTCSKDAFGNINCTSR